MSKSPSQASGFILLGCLCWIISGSIYLICNPISVLWYSVGLANTLDAQTVMWLFIFAGVICFLTALKKWWFEKPKF
jgi:hypothetical protein